MNNKKSRKFSHHKISQVKIKMLEQEYYDRLNAEIPQWQQSFYK